MLRFYPPNLRNKLLPPYIGPYLLMAKVGEVTYCIQQSPTSRPVAIHMDHLKYCRIVNPPEKWICVAADLGTTGLAEEAGRVIVEPERQRDTVHDMDDHAENPGDNFEKNQCRSHRRCRLPAKFADYNMGAE